MSSRPRLYPSDGAIGDVLEPPDTVAPLITPCIDNDSDRLRAMLTETEWTIIALATPQRIYDTMGDAALEMDDGHKVYSRRTLNLAFLLEQGALLGHAPVVRTLLALETSIAFLTTSSSTAAR